MPWSAGADVDLQRPAGGERDGGDEVLVGVDDPLAAEVVGDQAGSRGSRRGAGGGWSWLASFVGVTGGRWP